MPEVIKTTETSVVIDALTETVVIETPAAQGPAGPASSALAEAVVREIATDEIAEVRVDYDALVAATLFQ